LNTKENLMLCINTRLYRGYRAHRSHGDYWSHRGYWGHRSHGRYWGYWNLFLFLPIQRRACGKRRYGEFF
ncbi:MAG: hypothetical protein ACLU62_03785, partial [Hydrogeniiclostridium sp.]